MTNVSRRYYERELGAGLGPSPSMKEHFGYSEPLRRFIQRESFEPQANEIPNNMPSWLPGDDYMTNFKVGDPYVRVDDGYARLPGAGYEAVHPELEGLNPEEYPDIHKLRILSDVAPYSREYNQAPSSCLTQKLSRMRGKPVPALIPHSSTQASARHDCSVPACVPSSSAGNKNVVHARTESSQLDGWHCSSAASNLAERGVSHLGNYPASTHLQALNLLIRFLYLNGRGMHFPYLVLILMEHF